MVAAALVGIAAADIPRPAAAYVLSPWVDLSLSGSTLITKASVDPSLTPAGMRLRAGEYLGSQDPRRGEVSPIFAQLDGIPPLLIQVGGNEILLSDATRLAARAAESQVDVRLEVTPGVPHVFQAFAAMLDEGAAALDSGARFIREHLGATALGE